MGSKPFPAKAARLDEVSVADASTQIRVWHMTPDAAGALVQATRNQFAIPAEQKTLQAKEETKQQRGVLILAGIIALGVMIQQGINTWNGRPLDGNAVVTLLGLVLLVIGGNATKAFLKDWMATKKPPGLT